MKRCPQCAEEVQDEAKVCRYCGYSFETTKARKEPAKTSGCAIVGGFFAAISAIVIVMILLAPQPGGFRSSEPPPPVPLTAVEKKKRLESCNASTRLGQESGFIRKQSGDTLVVDETQWDQLAWDNKMVLMVCVVVEKLDGDRPGDRDGVAVYGYRSGKRLAGGIPGAGTLAPD